MGLAPFVSHKTTAFKHMCVLIRVNRAEHAPYFLGHVQVCVGVSLHCFFLVISYEILHKKVTAQQMLVRFLHNDIQLYFIFC